MRIIAEEVYISDWATLPDGTKLVKDDRWHIEEEVSPGVFRVWAETEDIRFNATTKFIIDNTIFCLTDY